MAARKKTTSESAHGAPTKSHGDEFLSSEQLAERLNVPVSTLYFWRYKGRGPQAYRIGKQLRYRWSDVTAWLERLD